MKNCFKKTIAALLAVMLIMPLSVFGITASAEGTTYNGSCGYSAKWTLDTAKGELDITGSGSMYDYGGLFFNTEPTWNDYKNSIKSVVVSNGITSVGDYAFYQYATLQSVTLPDSVTSIGISAFKDCINLKTINVPMALQTISSYAFYNCPAIPSMSIPATVTSIGSYAFVSNGFSSLEVAKGNTKYSSANNLLMDAGQTEIIAAAKAVGIFLNDSVPSTISNVDDYAFYGTNLVSISLPNSVKTIGSYSFAGCHSLVLASAKYVETIGSYAFYDSAITSGYIPVTLKSLGSCAYAKCTKISSFSVESGNENYSAKDGVLFDKDAAELIACPSGKSGIYAVPTTVTTIDAYAFSGCSKLEGIAIPTNVTYISSLAFDEGNSITVYCKTGSVAYIYANSMKMNYNDSQTVLLDKSEIEMNYKSTEKITATVLEFGSYKNTVINWTSSNPEVATVDANGNVTATGKGTAVITATTQDGQYSKTCNVTVKYSVLQWIIIYILFGWIWYV